MNKAYIYLIISTLLWGGVFHVIKYPLAVAPPFVLLITRFTLTAILLSPFLFKNHNYRLIIQPGVLCEIIILSVIGICGYNILFTYGMGVTEPATGSLIIAANPVMTTLISRLWKKEAVSPIRWFGIVLAFAGLAFIVFEGKLANAMNLKLGPGNLILLGAPFMWAIYSVRSRDVLTRVPSTVFTAAIILLSLPPQGAMAIYQFDGWGWASNTGFWLGIAYLGILATGVSYLLWNEGVRLIGAARSSIFVNLIPVTALLIAMLLGQPLYMHHYVGGLIVVVGVILATRK